VKDRHFYRRTIYIDVVEVLGTLLENEIQVRKL
jgi:hypothetical protein